MLSKLRGLSPLALLIALSLLAGAFIRPLGLPAQDHGHDHDPKAAAHDHDGHKDDDAHHGHENKTLIEMLLSHVDDDTEIHLFETIPPYHIELKPILGFQITKFMLL